MVGVIAKWGSDILDLRDRRGVDFIVDELAPAVRGELVKAGDNLELPITTSGRSLGRKTRRIMQRISSRRRSRRFLKRSAKSRAVDGYTSRTSRLGPRIRHFREN